MDDNYITLQVLPNFNIALETLNWRVKGSLKIKPSNSHYLIQFEYGGKKFIYRFAKYSKKQIEKQVTAFKILGGHTPRIFYSDERGLIEEYIEGCELSLNADKKIWEQVGKLISQIHKIEANGFGKISSKESSQFIDFQEYQRSCMLNLKYIHAQNFLNSSELRKLEAYLLEVPLTGDETPKVCHGDFWMRNILFSENTGDIKLIDWENITSNYKEYDFVLFSTFNDPPSKIVFETIKQSYIYDLNDNLINYYKIRRVVDKYKVYKADKVALKVMNERIMKYRKYFI